MRLGVPICEDIWGEEIVECLGETGAEILVVPNGSPYWREKNDVRLNIAVARVTELARSHFAPRAELVFHPQCFLSDGHFAGPDEARLEALREVMADPSFDAIWYARGGYGSNRIAEAAVEELPGAARNKIYLGYSDAGFLHAGFHKAGLNVAWGPMNTSSSSRRPSHRYTPDLIVTRSPTSTSPSTKV